MNIKKLFILNLTHKVELGLENKKEKLKRSFMGFSLTKLILALSIIVVSSLTTQCSCSKTITDPNPATCVDGIGAIGACTGCNAGFYLTTANTCLSLPTNCSVADGNGVCTTCVNGFDVRGGACFVRVTIEYNSNAGTSTVTGTPPASQTAAAGETVTLAGRGDLARTTGGTADVFLGWSTAQNPEPGDWVAGGAMFNIPAGIAIAVPRITLYAVWGAAYTVTYDANGGTGGTNLSHGTLAGAEISLFTFAHTGITAPADGTFQGWGVNPNGTGTVYAAGTNQRFRTNTRLYAIWGYNITFECGTGDGITGVAPASLIRRAGVSLSDLPKGTCKQSGYDLTHWTTVRSGASRPRIITMPNGPIHLFGLYLVDQDSNGLIEIYNAEQLNAIRYNLAGSYWRSSAAATAPQLTAGCPATGCKGWELVADIDLGATRWGKAYAGADKSLTGWQPIGTCNTQTASNTALTATTDITTFNNAYVATRNVCNSSVSTGVAGFTTGALKGDFMGNGHTITNLWMSSYVTSTTTVSGGYALFAGTSSNVKIDKVYLPNIEIVIDSVQVSHVAGLVGKHRGQITNCYVTGSISGKASFVGGLVGDSRSDIGSDPKVIIRNSYTDVNIVSNNLFGSVGGLIGGADQTEVYNSYAIGSVTRMLFRGSLVSDGGSGNDTQTAAGGLIGDSGSFGPGVLDSRRVFVRNSYSGAVITTPSGASPFDFFVGWTLRGSFNPNTSITASYWDTTRSGGVSYYSSNSPATESNQILGRATTELQSTTDANRPTLLGSCFNLRDGKYPQLYLWSGTACLVGEPVPGAPNN